MPYAQCGTLSFLLVCSGYLSESLEEQAMRGSVEEKQSLHRVEVIDVIQGELVSGLLEQLQLLKNLLLSMQDRCTSRN